MRKSASIDGNRLDIFKAKGKPASILRRRKHELVRRFGFPSKMLCGALTLTHRRCGKPGCRCATGDGHAMWTLTSSIKGRKDVLVVPAGLVLTMKPLVIVGREYRNALTEVLAINAKLVRLWRQQQVTPRTKRQRRKRRR